ncbi:MAG: DUF305 domain-containing protein [Pedococcus sp.]
MKRRFSMIALALVAALALAACGDDQNSTNTNTNSNSNSNSSTSSTSTSFNDADVTFAQSMIPHHQQAVTMAKMARSHASSAEVKSLATRIEAAQGPEIATMTGWLNAWGKDVPSGSGMGGMDHTMGGDGMPGMMGESEMNDLDTASGAGFDRMFLTMMIEHHTGAIEMAKTEQSEGESSDAVALAKKIEADQTAEIAVMKDLLKS